MRKNLNLACLGNLFASSERCVHTLLTPAITSGGEWQFASGIAAKTSRPTATATAKTLPAQEGHGEFPLIGDGKRDFNRLRAGSGPNEFPAQSQGIRSKSELKSVSSTVLSTRLARAVADMVLSPGQMANMPDLSLTAIATAQALAGDAPRIRRMSKVEVTAGGSDSVAFLCRPSGGDGPEPLHDRRGSPRWRLVRRLHFQLAGPAAGVLARNCNRRFVPTRADPGDSTRPANGKISAPLW